MTVLRYAILIVLVTGAALGALGMGASSGERFLVDAAQSGAAPKDVSFWLLAGIAFAMSWELGRFALHGMPSLVGSLCARKSWLYGTLSVGLIGGAFYLM